ncbi:MAG: hypothetical protein DMG53_20885 [Acidobacteria bacterium]|nr:MAG: hypothetical protein DMG53_20885 [Acidobacteriota bacterium]
MRVEKAGRRSRLAWLVPKTPKVRDDFHRWNSKDLTARIFFPILRCLSGTLFYLSGAAPDGLESLSWKGIIFGPGTK